MKNGEITASDFYTLHQAYGTALWHNEFSHAEFINCILFIFIDESGVRDISKIVEGLSKSEFKKTFNLKVKNSINHEKVIRNEMKDKNVSVFKDENSLSTLQYLLVCLAEECGEVAQMIGKCMRFGIKELNPKSKVENLTKLISELADIVAVYELLVQNCNFPELSSKTVRKQIDYKKTKLITYSQSSVELKTVR